MSYPTVPRSDLGQPPLIRANVSDSWKRSQGGEEYILEPVPAVPQFRRVVASLRRRAWLVALVALGFAAAAGYYAYTRPPVYTASAVLRIGDPRSALAGGIDLGPAERLTGTGSDRLLTVVQLLRSRGVARRVVDQTGLRVIPVNDRELPGELSIVRVPEGIDSDTFRLRFSSDGYSVTSARAGKTVSSAYGVPANAGGIELTVDSRPATPQVTLTLLEPEAAVDRFLAKFQTSPRLKTDIIDLAFTAEDPKWAQRVVNTTAQVFQSLSMETAQRESRRRRLFIEGRLLEADSMQAAAQAALSAFRSRENVYSAAEKFAAAQSGLAGIEVRHAELATQLNMYLRLLQQVRVSRQTNSRDGLRTLMAAPGIATNPVVTGLFEQIIAYESALDSLTTGTWASAPSNPDVQRLRALVATTESRLTGALESHADLLRAQLAAIDELRSRSVAEIQKLPRQEAEDLRLMQQMETIQKMADQLREEYQLARISEAVQAGQVEIIDLAVVPRAPVSTHPRIKTLIALVLGTLVGGGVAILLDQMNTTIRRRDELESLLQLPELATVPRLDTAGGRRLPAVGAGIRRLTALGSRGSGYMPAARSLAIVSDRYSPAAEAYRSLRTNIMFSQAFERRKSLMFTSSLPGDGKTTTAANLAVALAHQGLRVLLIDADMRRPQMHLTFGLPIEPGLSQVLMGALGEDAAIRETNVAGLSVMPSGIIPPNPAELLGGASLRPLLDRLNKSFDYVIIDSPPVLAAADAAIVGATVGAVALVIRAGTTDRAAAQQAIRQLHAVGARVIGAVLNDPDARLATKDGAAGYYYSGSYGPQTA